jgi:hypothetical protein
MTQEHLEGRCSDAFPLVRVLNDESQGARPRPFEMQFGQSDRFVTALNDKRMMIVPITQDFLNVSMGCRRQRSKEPSVQGLDAAALEHRLDCHPVAPHGPDEREDVLVGRAVRYRI